MHLKCCSLANNKNVRKYFFVLVELWLMLHLSMDEWIKSTHHTSRARGGEKNLLTESVQLDLTTRKITDRVSVANFFPLFKSPFLCLPSFLPLLSYAIHVSWSVEVERK